MKPKRLLQKLFYLTLYLLSSLAIASVQPPIDLSTETSTDRNYYTLNDVNDSFSIDQFLYHTGSTFDWQQHSGDVTRGVLTHPVWMRFQITNSDTRQQQYLLEYTDPGPYRIDMYVVTHRDEIEGQYHYHREKPIAEKPYPNPGAVFPITLHPGEELTVYARIEHKMGGLFSQFSIWRPHHFIKHETIETALYGGVYTSFFIFSFIALVIFFATRDRVFLLYSGLTFTSAISLMNLDNHWGLFFQPGGVSINNAVIWSGAYLFMALAFAREYLKLNTLLPWASKLTLTAMWIGPIIIVLGLLGHTEIAGMLMMSSMGVILLVPFIALYLWLAKKQHVRLFTLAWFIYGTAICIQFALRQVGLVPHLPITIYSGAIGAMIEMCLLTASMGYRVLDLKRERDHALKSHVHQLEQFSAELENQVIKKTKELEQAKEQAEYEARTDPLTKLSNRRAFNEQAPKLIKSTLRNKATLCAIAIDIDHFKKVNDTHGHDIGDKVLIEVANALSNMTRDNDILARIGGEEFIVLATTNDQYGAVDLGERIRLAIEQLNIDIDQATPLKTTISIGLYTINQPEKVATILRKADAALYQSKMNGRNQVTAWEMNQKVG
ncbi:sensor domain-containing diguanylate cyclase [Motilimonas cestriensis]|uniref:diguanylate cyclase n=1 Tax=Motilimonas cestriensis TaxID=2742685 RepID=A0ABS8WDM9_9GAMM|nr:diguanylate cyclase [Motilimonas cestriensis]MCE2596417.1 sensor domain-containing diguanylate cyclase [Motilimonas cestriensis]